MLHAPQVTPSDRPFVGHLSSVVGGCKNVVIDLGKPFVSLLLSRSGIIYHDVDSTGIWSEDRHDDIVSFLRMSEVSELNWDHVE